MLVLFIESFVKSINLVEKDKLKERFQFESLNNTFFEKLRLLRTFDDGPLLAKKFLNKHGIYFFIEKHLPKTHLDGAVFLLKNNCPVIVLTLRFDRIDNFWFCLFHELAHLKLHFQTGVFSRFFDDLNQASEDNS